MIKDVDILKVRRDALKNQFRVMEIVRRTIVNYENDDEYVSGVMSKLDERIKELSFMIKVLEGRWEWDE